MLADRLHRIAREKGAEASGVCTAEPFVDIAQALRARIAGGLHGGLRFTFHDPDTATDVSRSFPWALRLFVVAWAYVPEAGHPGPVTPAATGSIARFATEDHYRGLRAILDTVAAALREAGHRAEVLADDHRLVDRAAAVRAGLGWWGKSTLVLAPRAGPWMLLGSVVTDAALPTTDPMRRDCGSCDACLPACPTGALVAPGVLDARRCLAAILQQPGVIPRHLRTAVGERLYGCDDCLEACPPGTRLLASATQTRGRVDLLSLLGTPDTDLVRRFPHFYLPKRRPSILRRNALVVLGNIGPGRDVEQRLFGAATGYLGHDDWVLRSHAAWAVGRFGGDPAIDVLSAAAAAEDHPEVIDEIRLARAAAAPSSASGDGALA